MYRFLLLFCMLVAARPAHGQPAASISGFVTDATSGETLLLANVVLEETAQGVATNNAGYYTITGLEAGRYTVVASYIGYRPARVEVTLEPGERRRTDLSLVPEDFTIEEVTVTADRQSDDELRRLGAAQLRTDVIRRLPTVLEPDVFRALQLLPGVKAASDYSSGLYIRGGSPDQTLILIDRTTVYNPSHFFGFFSTFNPDAIKDVRLFKGGYPAEYGGRLGSVVDIYNKDGNRRRTQGSVSVGLLASRALVEGPFSKGSWMLAVRRSTLEPVLAALRAADVENIPDRYYFYDANGKLNYDVTPDDRLALAFYAGRDALDIGVFDDVDVNLVYGNRTLSATWTHILSEQLFSTMTATSSRYASLPVLTFAGTGFEQDNRVYDTSLKGDVEYVHSERHALEAGIWAGSFILRFRNVLDGRETLGERIRSFYSSAYAQHTYRPGPHWQWQAGLRLSYFEAGDYLRLEPRASVEYRPAEAWRLQAGYGRYYQFLTLITSELFSGFDTWLTTGPGVPPSFGDQFVAGVKVDGPAGTRIELETYFRTMRDLFELDPFLPDVAGLDYDQLFRFGDGRAYGAELLLQKLEGSLSGFIGYTAGRTWRRYPQINEGRFYAPKYDRTHDLNVVANLELARQWRLTGVFTYATGQAYTEPQSQFKLYDDPFSNDVRNVLVTTYNNARLPAYHRLDLGVSKLGRFFGVADYELQVQVINAYRRRNVWFYFYEFRDDNEIERREVPQIPVPVPNLSLTVRF